MYDGLKVEALNFEKVISVFVNKFNTLESSNPRFVIYMNANLKYLPISFIMSVGSLMQRR